MTSQDIKNWGTSKDRTKTHYWLQEIAYQLAIRNEAHACSPAALHAYTEWPAAVECPSCRGEK